VNISDYLINHDGKNWPELLSGWSDLLPESLTVWMVNRFGDVFVIFEDGSIHMLDVGAGEVRRLAVEREKFCARIDTADNANDWLMSPLVDRCVNAGITLAEGQCYGYRIPPLLGGEYTPENVYPTDIAQYYSLLADKYRQTKDLPDGTKVRVVVDRDPTLPVDKLHHLL